jgi:hypothetical protein
MIGRRGPICWHWATCADLLNESRRRIAALDLCFGKANLERFRALTDMFRFANKGQMEFYGAAQWKGLAEQSLLGGS